MSKDKREQENENLSITPHTIHLFTETYPYYKNTKEKWEDGKKAN